MKLENDIICPNCQNGFNKEYDYCPHCGQKNKELKMGFKFLFSDFLAGSFNIDSKFFTTFKVLLFSPGKLTIEFLDGKRTKYLTPLRIYLLVSFAYFAMLSFTDASALKFNDTEEMEEVPVVFDNSAIDSTLFEVDSLGLKERSHETFDFEMEEDSTLAGIELDKFKSLNKKEGRNEFKEKFNEYTSISMFFIMPLAAVLLFWFFKKRSFYFEHLIFLIHLQSLIFLILIVAGIIHYFLPYSLVDTIGNLLTFFIIILWVKSFYNYGWVKTIFSSLLLVFSYLIVLGISFIILAWFSLFIL